MPPLRTNVYVDGFNFYYGCVKNTLCKWLSFRVLCSHLLDPQRSDLLEPVRIVRHELGIPVGMMFPVANARRKPSAELAKEANFMRRIRSGVLKQSQLPNPIPSPVGDIFKPAGW